MFSFKDLYLRVKIAEFATATRAHWTRTRKTTAWNGTKTLRKQRNHHHHRRRTRPKIRNRPRLRLRHRRLRLHSIHLRPRRPHWTLHILVRFRRWSIGKRRNHLSSNLNIKRRTLSANPQPATFNSAKASYFSVITVSFKRTRKTSWTDIRAFI